MYVCVYVCVKTELYIWTSKRDLLTWKLLMWSRFPHDVYVKRDLCRTKKTSKRDRYTTKKTSKRDVFAKIVTIVILRSISWRHICQMRHISDKRDIKKSTSKNTPKETCIHQKRPPKETHSRKRPISEIWSLVYRLEVPAPPAMRVQPSVTCCDKYNTLQPTPTHRHTFLPPPWHIATQYNTL
jgi:hypothetical protein